MDNHQWLTPDVARLLTIASGSLLSGVILAVVVGAIRKWFKDEPPEELVLGDRAKQLLAMINDPVIPWVGYGDRIQLRAKDKADLRVYRGGASLPEVDPTDKSEWVSVPGVSRAEARVLNKAADERAEKDRRNRLASALVLLANLGTPPNG